MSGATSRTKGKVGEREIAALVADLTGWAVKRRVRQHEGDSDLEGAPGWSVEAKRHASATRGNIAAWWAQAVAQATRSDDKPVLFYRLNRADWRAVWSLGLHLGADWTGYEMTVEGSVEAWATVARELHLAQRSMAEPSSAKDRHAPGCVAAPGSTPPPFPHEAHPFTGSTLTMPSMAARVEAQTRGKRC